MALLALLGIGGKGNNVSITAALNEISSSFVQSVVKVKNTCKASATTSNIINNQTTSTADTLTAITQCIDAAKTLGFHPSECSTYMTQNRLGNIKQKVSVQMSTDCKLSTQDVKDLQTQMTSDLQQKVSSTTDGVTNALADIANAFAGGSDTKKNTTTNIQNFVQKTFTTDVCNQIITQLTSQNILNNVAVGLSYQSVDSVEMSVESTAMVSVLTQDAATAKVLDDLKVKAKQENSEQVKGLADIVDSIGSVVKSIFSTWVGIAAVVGLVAIGFLYFASKFFSGSDTEDVVRKHIHKQVSSKLAKMNEDNE